MNSAELKINLMAKEFEFYQFDLEIIINQINTLTNKKRYLY